MTHRSRTLLAVGIAGLLGGCDGVPPDLRPADMLRDSLGLTDTDAVWEVGLTTERGREVVDPVADTVDRAGWLSFRSDDPRARRVIVDTVGLTPAQRSWLGDRIHGSPPLVYREARWLLDLADAPAGTIRFRVSGSGEEGEFRLEILPRD